MQRRCGKQDCACKAQTAERRRKNGWVLRVMDSLGKLPEGFLTGDTFWLGDFNECRKVSR